MKLPIPNLNSLDRSIRGLLAIIALYFGFFGGEIIGEPIIEIILILFGLANLVSVLTAWCVVYHFADINTCREDTNI